MDVNPAEPLVSVTDVQRGVAYTLGITRYAIGSDPACDLPLDADGALPIHCELLVTRSSLSVATDAPWTVAIDGVPLRGAATLRLGRAVRVLKVLDRVYRIRALSPRSD